ncbi:fatty acyl-AMP ligase [Saccharopolyspora sp. NFXS83]|uniref:fatty acyl-AMP ligase n=1 Tax=Saccharopolyspora sp. NFXS83 TaxID=2993560 RepID=UPI00224B743B|nr:fatty acyl-AMP ligase [Saccharopolyspora sp. NFXS83]MCX2733327.1 fatty acyl-AMP ligase [Saccharopolyspora sp. NFXS83]
MLTRADDPFTDHAARLLTDPLVAAAQESGDEIALTFVDFDTSRDGVAWSLSWFELHQRVRTVAAWLQARCEPGDRVAIMAPQGLEYVVGFLGAVHAGLIAVPLFTPDLPGHTDRLERVLESCSPSCALTSKGSFDQVREMIRGGSARNCAAVETLPAALADDYRRPDIGPDDLAYLQYTSGSTRVPAGVELTHANVLANARQALEAYGGTEPDAVSVSWLPLFHDMGLVLSVAAPLVGSIPSVLMDPVAFLQRPGRWLRLLSNHPGAISAAPNFAYDFCAARIGEDEKAWLRLDDVISLINGSEPVRPATLQRFNAAFAECGLRPETHRCSYGLAEATVFVSVTESGAEPKVAGFGREQLALGRAEPPRDPVDVVNELVSCGRPVGQRIVVVDPASRSVLPDGAVGEIWVRGPNTGQGYWGRDDQETFHAELVGAPAELPAADWLRTGDLGAIHDGELFITGRMKDVIIIDGRNHYPQDVELTVEQAHPALRKHHTAAFSITGEDGERLVIVAEFSRRVAEADRDQQEITRMVCAAVSAEHGVVVSDLMLVEPDVVPRTSSGKVARRLCRERYLEAAHA